MQKNLHDLHCQAASYPSIIQTQAPFPPASVSSCHHIFLARKKENIVDLQLEKVREKTRD